MNTRSFLSDVGCAEGSGNCCSNVTNALKLKVDFTFFFFFVFSFCLGRQERQTLVFCDFESPAEGRQRLPKGKTQALDLQEARTGNHPRLVSPRCCQNAVRAELGFFISED